MNESKISVRYARALFELAEGKKQEDNVFDDAKILMEMCNIPEVRIILSSPLIASTDKFRMITGAIHGSLNALTQTFLQLLFKNNREIFLAPIMRQYNKLYKNQKKIKTVEITTAVEIDDNLKEQLKKQVLKTIKGQIELSTHTNPDLVGGLIVQVDDILYDASVRLQLEKIKKGLVKEKL